MIIMLGLLFYLTIAGANIPSSTLAEFFGSLEQYLKLFFEFIHAPDWLYGVLVLGLYRGPTWSLA